MSVDPRQLLAQHGYTPALWLAPGQRFLAPGGVLRTVSLEEALAEIEATGQGDAA